jgi:hypothetical protein
MNILILFIDPPHVMKSNILIYPPFLFVLTKFFHGLTLCNCIKILPNPSTLLLERYDLEEIKLFFILSIFWKIHCPKCWNFKSLSCLVQKLWKPKGYKHTLPSFLLHSCTCRICSTRLIIWPQTLVENAILKLQMFWQILLCKH